MTKLLKGLYAAGLGAVLLASATTTEAADLKCAIPFAFSVNDRALPAGIYDVNIEQGVLMVKSGNDGAYVLVNRLESTTNRASKLVFHKIGDDYVLFQAWSGSSGRQLPRSKRESRRGDVAANIERVELPLL